MSRDIPIIFSAPMVQALIAGRKTMTRRILPNQPTCDVPANAIWAPDNGFKKTKHAGQAWSLHSPYLEESRLLHATARVRYSPGDRLWVRENFSRYDYNDGCWYWADGREAKWDAERPRPSIHMPRWASRLTLIVTAVKIERLQDISEADAIAEGWPFEIKDRSPINPPSQNKPIFWFAGVWLNIHGNESWDANPWVVAISFRVIRANIDAPEARAA
jgi:hypothetical protein